MAAPSFHPALVGQQLAASQEELVTTCRLPCRQHIQPQCSFRFDWHVGYTPASGMHVVGGDEMLMSCLQCGWSWEYHTWQQTPLQGPLLLVFPHGH